MKLSISFLLCFLLVAGCNDKSAKEADTEDTEETTTKKKKSKKRNAAEDEYSPEEDNESADEGWTAKEKKETKATCSMVMWGTGAKGAVQEFCACIVDKVEYDLTPDEFYKRFNKKKLSSSKKEKIDKAMEECGEEYRIQK